MAKLSLLKKAIIRKIKGFKRSKTAPLEFDGLIALRTTPSKIQRRGKSSLTQAMLNKQGYAQDYTLSFNNRKLISKIPVSTKIRIDKLRKLNPAVEAKAKSRGFRLEFK